MKMVARIWRKLLRRRAKGAWSPDRRALASLVDAPWYLATYPDVAAAGADAVEHFVAHGLREGRRPNRLVDPAWYAATYPDVDPKGALRHYLGVGWKQGRWPGPDFDPVSYLAHNPDVAAAGAEPLTHYWRHGRVEGRRGATGARRAPGVAAADASRLAVPPDGAHPAIARLRHNAERQAALFRARDAITAEMLDQRID